MNKLAAALLLVTVGWFASPAAVPVYDGIGNPDQPYKYVGKPDAPAPATAQAAAGQGLSVVSSESGPQVRVDLGEGSFAGAVTMTATPVAGNGQAVPQGTIDGNVYRITATAQLVPSSVQGFLWLRAAVMTTPDPVIVHRTHPTDPWTKVPTSRTGRDIMSTPFRALGDYAVVRLPGSKPLSASGGLSGTRLVLLGGGVLVLVAITILVLRRPVTD